MRVLYFATSNEDKFIEVERALTSSDIMVEMAKLDLLEIQANDLSAIAAAKAEDACNRLNDKVLVEDDGLFVAHLRGFPGPYSAFVWKTIGNAGILQLMEAVEVRKALFKSVMAYCEPGMPVKCFAAEVQGLIAENARGTGWGYDPIFIPDEPGTLTYAELEQQKDLISHRSRAIEKFKKWWLSNP